MIHILRSELYGSLTLNSAPKKDGELHEFSGDAADYLDDAYDVEGPEAEVYLDILKDSERESKRIDFTKYESRVCRRIVHVGLK